MRRSSQRRQRRVLAWLPVPKASPGSSRRFTAPASGGVCQLGTTQSRGDTRTGPNAAFDFATQSSSGTSRSSCCCIASPDASHARRSTSAGSCPRWHSAVTRTLGHEEGSPGSVRLGGSPGARTSSQDTDKAPASISASERTSASPPDRSTMRAVSVTRPNSLSRRLALLVLGKLLLEVVDVDPTPDDTGIEQQFLMQSNVRLDTLDDHFRKRDSHAPDGLVAVGPEGD